MNQIEPKFSLGSLFICSKCGKDFSSPDNADQLKSSLRSELKDMDKANDKIRVMVSGCLAVCESGEQAFAYYPNIGEMELYSIGKKELDNDDKIKGHKAIINFLKTKLKN
jgi:hypothetical protein